ncbi:MAG: TIGR02556 family CRISPR-associated protein [Candidatus Atabeyarchaeum deiterrae]
MIEAVAELGEYMLSKEEKGGLSTLVDDPRAKHVLSIVLKRTSGGCEYEKVELEEYDFASKEKYLYRRGASQGSNVSPSSVLLDPQRTFEKKFLYWFSDENMKRLRLAPEERGKFAEIKATLERNKERIIKEMEESSSDLDPKERKPLLTLKFEENGSSTYIGDHKIFEEVFIERLTSDYYNKYNTTSLGRDAICSICLRKSEKVYGFTSDIFPFYTLDKRGFAPGLNRQNAWKLYPICHACTLKLEAGKRYLGKKLNLSFYGGFRYYLIPRFIFRTNRDAYDDVFAIVEKYARDPSFSEKERGWLGGLVASEDTMLRLLGEQKNDVLTLSFLFYERPKPKELKILLSINEVLPSRLKRLYETKIKVDSIKLFANGRLAFNFKILHDIFLESKGKDTSQKYYLDTVGKMFVGRDVDYALIMAFLIRRIRNEFVKGRKVKKLTLQGLMLFTYLHGLGILHDYGGVKDSVAKLPMQAVGKGGGAVNYTEVANGIFAEFKDFFNSDTKKAIFLIGVLTQKLLNIQFQERGSRPFVEKLNGLKLDERKLKALLPAIQGKLEEYGKNYYRELEKLISNYFMAAGEHWSLSNDEVSYYFVVGMNMVDAFKTGREEEKDEGAESNE